MNLDLDGQVVVVSGASVAAITTFLLSPRAAHIVGTSITVDGGQTGGR